MRSIKDEWRPIHDFDLNFKNASVLFLELLELAGDKRYEQKRSQDWRDEIKRKSESMLVV